MEPGDSEGVVGVRERLAEPVPQLPASSPVAKGRDLTLTSDFDVAASAGAATRFDANLSAIRTLKNIEAENRQATPEEQAIMGRYSGFGDSAFGEAFNRYTREGIWKRRADELKEITSPEEYQALERSRLNAFYTSPEVIRTIWQGLEHLGANNIAQPRILEPSAGSGRFLGMEPPALAARSQRTAVELDSLTGRMLKQTYPDSTVYVMGYQDAPIPDDSIDIAISNVPFGNYPVTDPAFRKGRAHLSRSIHNYFFAKTLDKLRPGGVLAFVTSHNTLDAPTAKNVRESLAERADLLAAIRLPKSAFPDTEVVTDIVFMRKRLPGEAPRDQGWVNTQQISIDTGERSYRNGPVVVPASVNQYFIDHPDMVLGRHAASGSMYREKEYTVEPLPGRDLHVDLTLANQRLPRNTISAIPGQDALPRVTPTFNAPNVREGGFVIDEQGQLRQKQGGIAALSTLPAEDQERVRAMLGIRDAARGVLGIQLKDGTDSELKESQQKLAQLYDTFAAQHGSLNSPKNADLIRQDPDAPFIRALERTPDEILTPQQVREVKMAKTPPPDLAGKLKLYTELKQAATQPNLIPQQVAALKMPLFTQRVVSGIKKATPSTAEDAVTVSLNESGRLDFPRMGEMLGRDPEAVRSELAKEHRIFKNPVGDWETADQYLSGNVRENLRTAEAAATANPAFKGNVKALQEVQPADIPPSQISARLGVPWIPTEDVNTFTTELLGAQRWGQGRYQAPAYYRYVPVTGEWIINEKMVGNPAKMTAEWGTSRMPADKIIERVLNSKLVEVSDKDEAGKSVRNPEETIAAQEKAKAIQKAWEAWLWRDPVRAERLSRIYNDTFNNMRPRRFDGQHQSFPGMTVKWAKQLHPQQRDGVWRITQDRTALLAHEVGFGKSAVMVAGGMELRRLGLSNKNMYVVPKATQAQFRDQVRDIYPYAKVLYPGTEDFTPARRTEFLSRAVTGDWDAIILSGEQFKRIPIKPETEARFLRQEINNLRAALEAEEQEGAEANRGRRQKETKTHKEIQKTLIRHEERLNETLAKIGEKREHTIDFEDMGVDQLFVDEADMYKNLHFATKMGRIKGLPNGNSERAWDMYEKVRVLQDRGRGTGVVFATGTPIANTVAELYTQMRYLQEPMLESRGLQHFDAWAKTFGETTEDIEQTPTGGYRLTQRFAKFQNIPELNNIWQSTADIRVADDSPNIVRQRPRLINEQGQAKRTVVTIQPDPALLEYMKILVDRADNLKNVDPHEDNMLKISNDARMASLDVRMVSPGAPEPPDGKLTIAAQNVARIYKETTPNRGTQLVFLDIGTPKAQDKPLDDKDDQASTDDEELDALDSKRLQDVYGALRRKMVADGIPDNEIAFIHDAKNDRQRMALFEKVNNGQVRVLIGSTGKMGAGVNIQERSAALHHLDAPWRPRDIEQREGRVLRQGNKAYGPQKDPTGKIVDPGPGVRIYTYVTERSFDAYMWQAIEAKAKAIKSIMRREATGPRGIEDADSLTMSAGEAKALASGNPDVLKYVTLKNDVGRLQLLRGSHTDAQIRAQQQLATIPEEITQLKKNVGAMTEDAKQAMPPVSFALNVNGQNYSERPDASKALHAALLNVPAGTTPETAPQIGRYRGFTLKGLPTTEGYTVVITNPTTGSTYATTPVVGPELTPDGLMRRVDNKINGIESVLAQNQQKLKMAEAKLVTYREQTDKPFAHEARLTAMQAEMARLDLKLQGQKDIGEAIEIPPEETPPDKPPSVPEPAATLLLPATTEQAAASLPPLAEPTITEAVVEAPAEASAEKEEATPPPPAAPMAEAGAAPSPLPKIGDNFNVMGVASTMADTQTIGGVRYELFNDARLRDKGGALRVLDVDSGQVVTVKRFPTFDVAEKAYKDAIGGAARTTAARSTAPMSPPPIVPKLRKPRERKVVIVKETPPTVKSPVPTVFPSPSIQTPRGLAQDKRRLARRVVPKPPVTEQDLHLKELWQRHPNKLDSAGVDTPSPNGPLPAAPTPKPQRPLPRVGPPAPINGNGRKTAENLRPYRLPSGEKLPSGQFPKVVSYSRGFTLWTVDLETGAVGRQYNFGNPSITPKASFKVLKYGSKRPPKRQFREPLFILDVTRDSIDFTERPMLQQARFHDQTFTRRSSKGRM